MSSISGALPIMAGAGVLGAGVVLGQASRGNETATRWVQATGAVTVGTGMIVGLMSASTRNAVGGFAAALLGAGLLLGASN